MKKIYSLLLVGIMVLIGGKASAADVTNPTDTLDFSVIATLDEAASTPKYGKFECGIGSASNQSMKPNISTSQDAFRLWPGNTVTLSANEGLTVSKVEFTYTSSNKAEVALSGDNGTFADGVWTGSAASVTFYGAGSGYTQTKIAKIVVSYTGSVAAAVNAPVFSKKGVEIGKDAALDNVTDDADTIRLTVDEGCTAYYTLDGTDATTASTAYTDGIVIDKTTTIKAIAVNAEGKTSSVAGFTYYINKLALGADDYYYESFDKCLGYNGNTGDFTQPNSSKVNLNRGGEFSGSYFAGDQCVYLARQFGQDATFTTPALDSLGTALLTFRIAANDAESNITLSATNASLETTEFTAGNQAWNDVNVKLSNVKAGATVTFSGSNLFLDEVKVSKFIAPDMTITFADSIVGKNVEIGIGGTGSFQMDWGDGVKKDYSGADYFSDTLKSNELKVYGDNILILLAANKGITKLDVANEPDMYRFTIDNNAIDSLDLTNCTGIRGLYASNNNMKSVKLGANTSSRPAVVDLSGNDLSGVLDLSSWSNLSKLDVTGSSLDSIGLPHSETLNDVACDSNLIKTLDVSNCSGLVDLSANACRLESINLKGATSLEEIYVGTNKLESIDLSDNTALTSLTAYGNNIKSIDLSKNTKLQGVYLYDNQLSALDLSKNSNVRWLNVENNKLAELNTSNLKSLSYLIANHNELTSVDLSANTSLSQVKLGSNHLTEFPAINASYLSYLKVDSNEIASIDLSNYSYLYWAELQNNQLSDLDVTHNTYLQWLAAGNNRLSSLDVTKNTGLQGLTIEGNLMRKPALDSIINALPDVSTVEVNANNQHFAKILNISDMYGTQLADKQPAVDKGWNVIAEGSVADGINQINSDNADKASVNAPMYNLAGQRVDKSYKGVVIQNGKKFINK